MASPIFPDLPQSLESLRCFLELASNYDSVDVSISYWSRVYAVEKGLLIEKFKEDMDFLQAVMCWLQKIDEELKDQKTICDFTIAQAHIESVAMKIYHWAQQQDRAGKCDRIIVGAFGSAGILLDIIVGLGAKNCLETKNYIQSRGSYLMSCLEKNVQPELPQNGDEKELLEKFDKYLSVSDTTDKPIHTGTEQNAVTFFDVHQQITTNTQPTDLVQQNQIDFPVEQQLEPQMHVAPVMASSPPIAHSMLYSPQSPMMNQIPILFVSNDSNNLGLKSPMYPFPNPTNFFYPPGNMVPLRGIPFQAQPRASIPFPFPRQTTPMVYYTQQGPVSPTVSTPQSLSSQHRDDGNVEKRARPSALRIVDPDTSTDVLTGEKVVPSEMATLPMTPPPDFLLTPTSESRMAVKESCTRISNERVKPNNGSVDAASAFFGFQQKLATYLRGPHSIEEICLWVQEQHLVRENPVFIRALATVITDCAIDGCGVHSKLNIDSFKKWTEILKRNVDSITVHELQLLFAIQAVITQRNYPKGLIQGVFKILNDFNVVSQKSFSTWVTNGDPSEREMKITVLKSIMPYSTFNNLQGKK